MSNPVTPLTPQQVAEQEIRAAHEDYVVRVLVAFDTLLATGAGGTPDVTISADAGIAAFKDRGFKGFYGRVMSGFLNIFQKDHGADAAAGDLARAERAIALAQASGLLEGPTDQQSATLTQFVSQNHGVLVTLATNGDWTCACCSGYNTSAALIAHASTCVLTPFAKDSQTLAQTQEGHKKEI